MLPAIIIATNVIKAKAPVTAKLPVIVPLPPGKYSRNGRIDGRKMVIVTWMLESDNSSTRVRTQDWKSHQGPNSDECSTLWAHPGRGSAPAPLQ